MKKQPAGVHEEATRPRRWKGATIQMFKDSAGDWCWRVKAGNREIVSGGEAHRRVSDARRAAMRVCALLRGDVRIEEEGSPRAFVLPADGELLE